MGRLLIGLVRLYQICLAPLLGPRCRFYPSCSRYAVSCLETYTLPKATSKITLRILRCNPWHPGGVDLP
ncbi:MAG: membrane protein insertion efficiency factor YidD [Chitinophagaceae bacterium]|nr:membrane protein insertion efficiency factor YidD [Oligoflexus sp.]